MLKGIKIKQIQNRLYNLRFELLLASIVCIFVLNVIFPADIYTGKVQGFYLLFQLFAGINLFGYSRKRISRFIWLVGGFMVVGRMLDIYAPIDVRQVVSFIYICFFGWVMTEVFRQMYRAEVVNRKIVLAAICGLLLIGYCGFFVFTSIEFFMPGSFRGLSVGEQGLNELFYYSYVTIMTIGYGDITPVNITAKNATVLVALLGYVYSLVVVARIVGQFSSRDKN